MQIDEINRKILRWLRGLGSAPIGVTESNIHDLSQAARKAAEEFGIAPDLALQRLKELQAEGLIEIVNRPNCTGIYWTRITDDGRDSLRAAEQDAKTDDERPIVFVSCSQSAQDLELGKTIAQIITDETPAQGYFAQNETTFEAVTTEILGKLARCRGFVGIMHHRGKVTALEGPPFQRASVWVEQEIAIAAYRQQILKEPIPVQLYIQNGIRREGLRDKVLLNAESFDSNEQVIEHFRRVVNERFASLGSPAPSAFQATSPLPHKQRRVTLERAPINPDWVLGLDVEPLQYRTTASTFDSTVQERITIAVQQTEFGESGKVLHARLEPTARATSVWLQGETPPGEMGQRPPQPFEQIEMDADGAFCVRFNQNDENTLDRVFAVFGTAYHLIRSLYPDLGLVQKTRGTLAFNLHAGRERHKPVLVSGSWTDEIDATRPFEVAFANLTLRFLRDSNVNWSLEEVEQRLREFAERNLP